MCREDNVVAGGKERYAIITGAAGFIGRHMARQLADSGWEVTGIGHGQWDGDSPSDWGVHCWVNDDITAEALARLGSRVPDRVFHCAGSGSVTSSIKNPGGDYHRTVTTTMDVLEYVRQYAPQTVVVYPSSGAVYGAAEKIPICESDPRIPFSPYGMHKCMAEDLCRFYAAQFNIQVAVVRLFSIFGNGLRKQLLWDACRKISSGEDVRFFGSGKEKRDWLHIEDTVALLNLAAQYASPECITVNGARGEGLEVKEILLEVFRAFDRTDEPAFLGEQRAGDPSVVVANISTVRSWGWEPENDWRKGIRDYVRWFIEEGDKCSTSDA